MSLPTIQPRVFYGLTNGIKGNATYISENEILYPAGAMLILHNYTQKLQRYIKFSEKQKTINVICVSPSRKVVAIAEKGEKPYISLYDLGTLKRKRVLGQSLETSAQEYVSLSFSYDGKYLAAILGEPDWLMVYFQWEKGKVDSTIKANNPASMNPGPVTQVACNPTDNSVLVVVGPQLFRLLSASEKIWRQYGWSKTESLNITSVVWLSFDRVMAGTSDGSLLLVDGGELKAVYRATTLTMINVKLQEETVSLSTTSLLTYTEEAAHPEMEVRALINFSKGFAYACGSGMVHLFEKETNHKYSKRNLFIIPQPEFQDPDMEDVNIVNTLSISPEEDRLLATTQHSQIYSVHLWGLDMSQTHEVPFKMVGEPLHHGPIVGLSICTWKPLFMTCGQLDHTVRVWNYETETQELVKQYQDEIFSVAIHPTGLYTVIGFSDKLRFMVLMMDDILPSREFSIRGCRECSFSISGHMFAAVNGNVIQVYSSISFENVYNLRGHNGKVTSLAWTNRDIMLVSCGTEGAIYEWDIPTGNRVGEIIAKECVFSSVAATTDGKISYGTGSDGRITEVSESMIVQAVNVMEQQLECIVLSRSNLMMFVAAKNGSVLSVRYPPQDPMQYTEYHMHNHCVTKVKLSYDDLSMITCSTDGTVCIWKLTFTEGKAVKMDKEFKMSSDILIGKVDLLERCQLTKDLTLRMHELETEHAYKMQKSEVMNAQKIKEVHEGYIQAIEELKEKNEQLESEHTAELNNINNNIAHMKTRHEEAILTLEANFNEKLIVEYDKYQALEGRTNKMREDYERRLADISEKRENDLSEMVNKYDTQLQEHNVQIEELHIQAGHLVREHEAIKQQIEDDADREIVELKTSYEKQLHDEREANLRLRGETGVMKKKFVSSQKEIEEFKHQVYTLQQEQTKFQLIIVGLERDISDLKKEISERDNTIQDKEKRIYDLKRKNQELDKFKFVLNYKITELKNQIEPKDREIKEKKEQIQDMEAELENLQRVNTSLDLQLAELKEKLNATSNEFVAEHQRNREANALLRRIRFDLHNASGLIQEPKKLKDTVKHLYHKYSQDSDFIGYRGQDIDAQTEFMRQREHLERTVTSLKRQVYKDTSGQRDDAIKMMDENATLIVELNNLRKELKTTRRQVADMESVLGISSKFMNPKDARAMLKMAVDSNEGIRNENKNKIEELERVIVALKEEVQRLVHKLSKEDQDEYQKESNQKMLLHVKTSNFSV